MELDFIRTVLGDVKCSEMGYTYSHEHIVIEDSYPTASNQGFLLNDVEKISEELIDFNKAGGKTVVDTMPANAGRNALKLAEVSRKSHVNIIAPTGLHLGIYYPRNHWMYSYSEDQLTELFIADIIEGIDEFDYSGPIIKRTPHKAGMIKLATGNDSFSKHEEKIFRAVVNTHLATGAPILTHTNSGKFALEQAELFIKLGAKVEHIVISHLDKHEDSNYHRKVLDTGVFIEYDSAFRWDIKGEPVNLTFKHLEALLPTYSKQIVLGMDMAKNTYWNSYGGSPGMNYLINNIPPFLASKGLEHHYENIFYNNPKALYRFFKTE